MKAVLHGLLVACLVGMAASAVAQSNYGEQRYNNIDTEVWAEQDVALPAFPREQNLIEFTVGNLTTNSFYIDGSTLTVGDKDRIVRYVLVVRTGGGATNVSYQGIHCEKARWKIYANGRSDGTWSSAHYGSEWKPIENKPVNRHHAELARNFFCPKGVALVTAAEGVNALRRGRHPAMEGAP